MSLTVLHHASIVKVPADIEPDEVVAFGEGRLGLAFKCHEAAYSWSHLIDLASFEVIHVEDEEKQLTGVVSLGTAWAISFGPISFASDCAACASGSLIVDWMGTWLVAGAAGHGDLMRFGLVGPCRNRRVSGGAEAGSLGAYRVPHWRLARAAQDEGACEPFALELGERAKAGKPVKLWPGRRAS